jgi:hypothetical protein
MFSRRDFGIAKVLLSFLLLPGVIAAAQRHGGGVSGGIPGGINRPDGVDEKDSLQDFHHSMAVQATNEQVAEFQALVKSTEAAKSDLADFLKQRSDAKTTATASNAQLDQALDAARSGNKKFVDGFSDKQKNGLKDLTKRIEKADGVLEQEQKRLDQSLLSANGPANASPQVESLDKALTDFSNEQLALGREMGIVLASGNDLAFAFTPVKTIANIGNQSTAVTLSGALSQISADGGQRKFKLQMVADLIDLQQNLTPLLRPQIERGKACGERLLLRQATIAPAAPASVLVLQLHYERWSCRGSFSSELAEGDGTVEMKLTPAVEKSNTLKLTAEYSRIDASGMMGDSLRSGDLGDDLRDAVTQSILPAIRAGVDFKAALPAAVQSSAVVQTARFQDASAGRLTVVLEGQMEVSNDQVNLMASQLNQSLAAQGATASPTSR